MTTTSADNGAPLLYVRPWGVPPRYAGCTFENFEPRTPELQAARDRLRRMVTRGAFDGDSDTGGAGTVLICGPTGTGKTHLATAALRATAGRTYAQTLAEAPDSPKQKAWATLNADDSNRWVTHRGLIEILEGRAEWDGEKYCPKVTWECWASYAVVLLDDLERPASRADADTFCRFVDGRYTYWPSGSNLIITTNLTPGEIREAFGDRTFDRLRDNATLISLTGASYRARNGWAGTARTTTSTTTPSEM